MSGYFQSLLARSRTPSSVVRPRIASIFEPPRISDAPPIEEASTAEMAPEPMRAVREPQSIAAPVSEPRMHAATRAPEAQVEEVAAPVIQRRVSATPLESKIMSTLRPEPRIETAAERVVSRLPAPAPSAPQETPAPAVARELHQTREVHETVREQRTLVDRTILERVASAGRRPQARSVNSLPVAAPEPEIHVSIGRIEVRAVNEPSSTRKAQQHSPVMGLDEYLRHKSKGAAQ
jgi:hypothetical protein